MEPIELAWDEAPQPPRQPLEWTFAHSRDGISASVTDAKTTKCTPLFGWMKFCRQANVMAARTGRTVAELIEEALRAGLAPADQSTAAPLPALPTFGRRSRVPGVDLTSNAAVLSSTDEVPVDARH